MFSTRFKLPTLLLLFSAVFAPAYAQSPQYTVTDLGAFIFPRAINESGQVAGTLINGRADAIFYDGTVVRTITPSGGASAEAWGINNFGDIAGEVYLCDNPNGCVDASTRGFIYKSRKNTYTILGTLGGRSSRAYDINDAGTVTGYSDIANGSSETHAFIFKDAVLTDIGAALASTSTFAMGINQSGQVVGLASSSTAARGAFRYDNGFFLFFQQQGWSNGINDVGDVVGRMGGSDDGSARAFLYSHGAIQDLGMLSGCTYASAFAVNNSGQVVGVVGPTFFSSFGHRAFIYSGGVMQDLNQLVPAVAGRVLTSAADINDAGQIIATGTINGEDHGFLLTPTQPMLLTQANSNQAIAVQSVMFLRDPFSTTTAFNLSTDTRTRLTILARNIETAADPQAPPPTVQAEDSLHRITSLPVEFVGKVPNAPWLTQIVVRLPEDLNGAGEIQLSISFRSRTSNKALLTVGTTSQ